MGSWQLGWPTGRPQTPGNKLNDIRNRSCFCWAGVDCHRHASAWVKLGRVIYMQVVPPLAFPACCHSTFDEASRRRRRDKNKVERMEWNKYWIKKTKVCFLVTSWCVPHNNVSNEHRNWLVMFGFISLLFKVDKWSWSGIKPGLYKLRSATII